MGSAGQEGVRLRMHLATTEYRGREAMVCGLEGVRTVVESRMTEGMTVVGSDREDVDGGTVGGEVMLEITLRREEGLGGSSMRAWLHPEFRGIRRTTNTRCRVGRMLRLGMKCMANTLLRMELYLRLLSCLRHRLRNRRRLSLFRLRDYRSPLIRYGTTCSVSWSTTSAKTTSRTISTSANR